MINFRKKVKDDGNVSISFTDHVVFEDVLSNEETCKLFLEPLVGKKIKKIKFLNKEHMLRFSRVNKYSILDLYVEYDDGSVAVIELMNYDEKEVFPLRNRYYRLQIDRKMLKRGDNYNKLKESYIIYFCTFDPFMKGKAIYRVESAVLGEDLLFPDRTHTIFLNTKYTDKGECDESILDLLSFSRESNIDYIPSCSLTTRVIKGVKDFRRDEKKMERFLTLNDVYNQKKKEGEVIGLNEGISIGMEKGINIGRNEGINTEKINTAKAMLKEGLSFDLISKITGLSIDDIKKLKS